MKSIVAFVLFLAAFLAGCGTGNSIVGVWELVAVDIPEGGQMPHAPITNKKNVYMANGIYHDTAAYSDRKTDGSDRMYSISGDKITIISDDGKNTYKFSISNDNTLVIQDRDGSLVTFSRLSHSTDPIPVIQQKLVPVRIVDGLSIPEASKTSKYVLKGIHCRNKSDNIINVKAFSGSKVIPGHGLAPVNYNRAEFVDLPLNDSFEIYWEEPSGSGKYYVSKFNVEGYAIIMQYVTIFRVTYSGNHIWQLDFIDKDNVHIGSLPCLVCKTIMEEDVPKAHGK